MAANLTCGDIATRRPRRFIKKILVAIPFFLLCMGLLFVPLVREAKWVGRFQLTVHVRSESSTAIESISFACATRIYEEKWEAVESDFAFKTASSFDGQSFTTHIMSWGTDRQRLWPWLNDDGVPLERVSYFYQDRLFLLLNTGDGRTFKRIADVPLGRGPREMTVTIP